MNYCRICKQDRIESDFYLTPAGNLRKVCKHCQYEEVKVRKAKDPEAWALQKLGIVRKHKYKITPEQVYAMLSNQNNRCAICLTVIEYRSAHLDHCHKTGKVRGLLCKDCNVGLGWFKDDKEKLFAAIKYLER